MVSELHLIVLWNNARYKEKEILEDVQKHIKIRDVYEIQWTKEKVADNFSRFYGQKLPDKSFKEQECGTGAFLCLVVEDLNPTYDFVETSRGHEQVNLTLFALKEKYRSWTNGGHKIHTTNSIQETNHDASLMLGLNYEDLGKSLPPKWDGQIKKINRDLTGCHGWKDLSEFFYTLNATINYAVLRNGEILPHQFKSDLHGDIDIITDNYTNICLITNTVPVFKETYRVHNVAIINNQKVYFDFRYLGDEYYCYQFEYDLLKHRYLNSNNIYMIDNEYLFYSLIYHALIHKQEVASDYFIKLHNLFEQLNYSEIYNIEDYDSPFDLYFQMLEVFMKKNGYTYTRPNDKTVYYTKKLVEVNKLKNFLYDNYSLKNIHTIYTDKIANSHNTFLIADDSNNKLFIKMCNISEFCKNEFYYTKKLYEIDNQHFVKPIYYKECDEYGFVATKFTKNKPLAEILRTKDLSAKEKKVLIQDLYQIYKSLRKSNVVHRDIRPQNLINTETGLVLIDFQLAVSKTKYKELDYLKKNLFVLAGLGEQYAKNCFVWDDNYSLLKILEDIGCESEYKEFYDKVYKEIEKSIGENQISYFNSHDKKIMNLRRVIYHIKSILSLSGKKRKKYRQKKQELELLIRNTKKR